jgi:hypothetical protein
VIGGTDSEDADLVVANNTGLTAACALVGRIRLVAAEEFEFLLADDFASVFKRAIGAPGAGTREQ